MPVAEDQFNQLLTSSAAAAGDLPDVIGGDLAARRCARCRPTSCSTPTPPAAVMRRSTSDTFSRERPRADPATATPSSRCPASRGRSCSSTARTCSSRPGCEPPDTYDAMLAAPQTLDSADLAGFVGANVARRRVHRSRPSSTSHWATTASWSTRTARSTLDSSQCVERLRVLRRPRQRTTPCPVRRTSTRPGRPTSPGQAAMIIWSTFILDEMAGLRERRAADLPGVRGRPGVPRQEQRRRHRDRRARSARSPRSSARSRRGPSPRSRRPSGAGSSSST